VIVRGLSVVGLAAGPEAGEHERAVGDVCASGGGAGGDGVARSVEEHLGDGGASTDGFRVVNGSGDGGECAGETLEGVVGVSGGHRDGVDVVGVDGGEFVPEFAGGLALVGGDGYVVDAGAGGESVCVGLVHFAGVASVAAGEEDCVCCHGFEP